MIAYEQITVLHRRKVPRRKKETNQKELLLNSTTKFKASPTTPPTDSPNSYLHSMHTHSQTHGKSCVTVVVNHKIQQHNCAYKSQLVSLSASVASVLWFGVSILNRSNKSWKKALKTRLAASRPKDRFHAYKPPLLSNSCRCPLTCDLFNDGTVDFYRFKTVGKKWTWENPETQHTYFLLTVKLNRMVYELLRWADQYMVSASTL